MSKIEIVLLITVTTILLVPAVAWILRKNPKSKRDPDAANGFATKVWHTLSRQGFIVEDTSDPHAWFAVKGKHKVLDLAIEVSLPHKSSRGLSVTVHKERETHTCFIGNEESLDQMIQKIVSEI